MKLFRLSNLLFTEGVREKSNSSSKNFFPELLYINCLIITSLLQVVQFFTTTMMRHQTQREQQEYRSMMIDDVKNYCTILVHLRKDIVEIEQTNAFMFVDHLLGAAEAA